MNRSEICICMKKAAAQSQIEVGTKNKGTGTVHEPAFGLPAANYPDALALARPAALQQVFKFHCRQMQPNSSPNLGRRSMSQRSKRNPASREKGENRGRRGRPCHRIGCSPAALRRRRARRAGTTRSPKIVMAWWYPQALLNAPGPSGCSEPTMRGSRPQVRPAGATTENG
jgi:hypothetical protein